MRKAKCNYCGDDRFEERRIDYLYSHKGEYLLVPNTPVEVCLNCGMVYLGQSPVSPLSSPSDNLAS
jgi:YgiT-type zinc finger domain-containing protein